MSLSCLIQTAGLQQRERWRSVPSSGVVPNGRIGHSVVVGPHQNVFLWGGVNESAAGESKYLDDCFIYNFPTKVWSVLPLTGDIPCGRAFHSAVVHHDEMLIFGGCNGRGRFNEVYGINYLTGVCRKVRTTGPEPSTRYCHSAVVHDDRMVVFGGKCGGRKSNKRLADMFALDLSTLVWESVERGPDSEDFPTSRSAHTAIVHFDKMIMFGGRNADGRCCEDLYEFHFKTREWRRIHTGPGPYARARHSVVVHNHTLLSFAGWNGKKKLNDLCRYNLDTQEFQLLHDSDEQDERLPCRRECHTSVVVGNTMLLFGGRFRGLFLDDNFEFDLEPPSLMELCREWVIDNKLDYKAPEMALPDALVENFTLYENRASGCHAKRKLQEELREKQGSRLLRLRSSAPRQGTPFVIHPRAPNPSSATQPSQPQRTDPQTRNHHPHHNRAGPSAVPSSSSRHHISNHRSSHTSIHSGTHVGHGSQILPKPPLTLYHTAHRHTHGGDHHHGGVGGGSYGGLHPSSARRS